jgi:hypothetical protein
MVEVRGNPLISSGLSALACGILSYFSFLRGEMDIAAIFTALFFASMAVSAYFVFKLGKKKTLKGSIRKLQESVCYWIAVVFLALIVVLIGVMSNNVVTMIFGTFLLYANASSFLTSYVKSDHIVKRTLEVALLFMALAVVVYGYVVTRSLILGIILLFAVTLFMVAFVLSFLLPKIRGK